MAHIIRNNKTLNHMDLRYNQLGAVGGRAISQAMDDNNTITSLNLYNNSISDAILEKIEQKVELNKVKKNEPENPFSRQS